MFGGNQFKTESLDAKKRKLTDEDQLFSFPCRHEFSTPNDYKSAITISLFTCFDVINATFHMLHD